MLAASLSFVWIVKSEAPDEYAAEDMLAQIQGATAADTRRRYFCGSEQGEYA